MNIFKFFALLAVVGLLLFCDRSEVSVQADHVLKSEVEALHEILVEENGIEEDHLVAPKMPGPEEVSRLIRRREADGYEVHSDGDDFFASNGRQRFSAQWSGDDGALRLESLDLKDPWFLTLKTRGDFLGSKAEGGRMRFDRGGSEEWFINDVRGLEHGFDVPEPLSGRGEDGFRISMELTTSLKPKLQDGERALFFCDHEGEVALRYQGLLVLDAMGRSLSASMELEQSDGMGAWRLALHVDDEGARYPLLVDPLFTTQDGVLTSLSPAGGEEFGASVAMCGNLLAVGVPNAYVAGPGEADLGAVDLFIYDKVTLEWEHSKRVVPENPVGPGRFGHAVDLKEGVLVVGAPEDSPNGLASGSAYVFQRDEGGPNQWGQVEKLVPVNGMGGAGFGSSVGVDGDLIAVGAPRHSDPFVHGGAVYYSYRSELGVWLPPQQLVGYWPLAGYRYGHALDVCGNRIAASALFGSVIGGPAEAGVVVVTDLLVGGNGVPLVVSSVEVTDSNPASQDLFGFSIALRGDEMMVGIPGRFTIDGADAGTVGVFRETPAGWTWEQVLLSPNGDENDGFGTTLAWSGDTLAVGSPFAGSGAVLVDAGKVDLFEDRSGSASGWEFVEELHSSSKQAMMQFGVSLCMSGDLMAMGAPFFDSVINGVDVGTVSALQRRSAAWLSVWAPNPGTGDDFQRGHAVAVDRDFIAVGAPGWTTAGDAHGRVTVHRADAYGEESWGVEKILVSPDQQDGERFGHSVALAGNWLLVGAPGYNLPGVRDVGRAYLFRRTPVNGWDLFKVLDVPILTSGASYGTAVALTSRWAFVGAPGMDHGFVFDRYEGGADEWDLSTIIDESAEGGGFGSAVIVDGNVAAFSAPFRNGVPPQNVLLPVEEAGQVKLYRAVESGFEEVWEEFKILPEAIPDGSIGIASGLFGSSLSLSHGLLMVGEPGYEEASGRVRVYGVNEGGADNWGELQSLVSPDPEPGAGYGSSVAAGSRWLFVGVPEESDAGVATGVVYSYDRQDLSEANQRPASRLIHPDSREAYQFGAAIAFCDSVLVVGAPGAESINGQSNAGVEAVFHRQSAGWNSLGGAVGLNATGGDQLGYSVSVDGEFLVAGAPLDSVNGMVGAGSVHLYRRDANTVTRWNFVKVIPAGDVQIGANFGTAVDIDGDVMVVGAPGWDSRGAVYVFHRNEGGADAWGQVKRIDLPFILNGDDFGAAVALEDGLLVVGAPGDNIGPAIDAGIGYVFSRHVGGTSNWGFLDAFGKPAAVSFEFFGAAVDVSEGLILVGAPLADETGASSGGGYLFSRPSGGATWEYLDTLSLNQFTGGERLGGSVSLDGDYCVMGATGYGYPAFDAGTAVVFRVSAGGNWFHEARLSVGDLEPAGVLQSLRFGSAVAMKGEQVVIGASGFDDGALDNVGAVYLYEQNQSRLSGWGLVRKIVRPEGGQTAQMGMSVAMTTDFIVAGAPEADQGGQIDAGNLFFFGDVGSAYLDWARGNFGEAALVNQNLEESMWGAYADPDGDGLENALEAYLASSPLETNAQRDLYSMEGGGEEDLVFRYRRGKETHGAVGRVKWSRNLIEWRGAEDSNYDEFEIVERVLRDEPDHFLMEARISADQLVGEPILFMRLEVSAP